MEVIDIQEFINYTGKHILIDVRSPSEFIKGNIPYSLNIPLLNDEERSEIGTIYKQESRRKAIKRGLDFFGPKMRSIVEKVDILTDFNDRDSIESIQLIICCWRGGMRSNIVAWLLGTYGYKVSVIKGGYKSYRNWCISQFEKPKKIILLGGFTGSGKTIILDKLREQRLPVIDLEKLANHKGSAFGGIGQGSQPSQEYFENHLAYQLYDRSTKYGYVIVEDESQRIGAVSIPQSLWEHMKRGSLLFIVVDFNLRLKNILAEYGRLDRSMLASGIVRLQKKLGGLETKECLESLVNKDYSSCFTILLRYYDKLYHKSFEQKKILLESYETISIKDYTNNEISNLITEINKFAWA